ncbi:hypothetical protein LCGC14_2311410, partial [marine sediment metagenome]
DRTSLIGWRSFRFDQALTNQIDTVNFTINIPDIKGFKPDLLDDLEILEDSVKIFGGKIVKSEEVIDGLFQKIRLTAKDHSHEMDSRVVVAVFENTTINQIIEDIKDEFLPAGFTTNNVNLPNPVDFIAFNYEQPSKVFQQLAELVGADWFVDVDKDLNFFSKAARSAPFELNDTGANFIWNSLKINRDVKNLRNTIFVRGGTFSGNTFDEVQEADGETETFTFGFKYKSVAWAVDRGSGFVAETFGIDNIDDPADFDWLYNFQEKAMKLGSATIPSASDRIRMTGLPQIPVIIKTKDNTSVNKNGPFEGKVVDKSIDSKEGARERANQEIILWANQINEGSFRTRSSGLEVGQQITIDSTIRDINEKFHISRIGTRFISPTAFEHTVTLMSQKTFGMVEFLQGQLIDKDKEIEIDPDEVLDEIESAFENIIILEALVEQITTQIAESIGVADLLASVLFTPPYVWAGAGQSLPSKLRWNLGIWS